MGNRLSTEPESLPMAREELLVLVSEDEAEERDPQ